MSFALPDGSVLQYAKTIGSAVPFTAISNAVEAVLTLDNDPELVADDDIVIVRTPWDEIDNIVARAKSTGAAAATLEGIDTSYTKLFSALNGAPGNLYVLGQWTEVTQIEGLAQSGGEAGSVEIRLLKSSQRRARKSGKSPIVISATIHDDVALPWFADFKQYDQRNTEVPFRIIGEDNQVAYFMAQVALGGMPTLEADQTRKRTLVLPLVALATEYDEV